MAILKHRVLLEWGGSGSPGVNTWHSRLDEATASSPQAVVDTLKNFYTAQLPKLWGGMRVTYFGNPFAVDTLEEFPVTTWTITSASTQVKLPSMAMLCVSWKTSVRARRGMGRTFLGPLNRDCDQGDGTPTASVVDGTQIEARQLVAESDSHVGQALGVYGLVEAIPKDQVPTGKEPRVLRDFTSATVRDSFAVLRSRRD